MFIFKVIHSFLVEITSYFKGNPKSFEPPILRTETLVPKSCTYKYSFFGNRNPFKTSLSLSTQKNQTHPIIKRVLIFAIKNGDFFLNKKNRNFGQNVELTSVELVNFSDRSFGA